MNVSSELLGDSTELYLLDYSIFSRDRAYADTLPIVTHCACVCERERAGT